jgi:hypothetical protein
VAFEPLILFAALIRLWLFYRAGDGAVNGGYPADIFMKFSASASSAFFIR